MTRHKHDSFIDSELIEDSESFIVYQVGGVVRVLINKRTMERRGEWLTLPREHAPEVCKGHLSVPFWAVVNNEPLGDVAQSLGLLPSERKWLHGIQLGVEQLMKIDEGVRYFPPDEAGE